MDNPNDGKSTGKRQVVISYESERISKKRRFVWTAQLYERFIEAIISLGIEDATPTKVTELMNVEGLSEEILGAHFHRFMLDLLRLHKLFSQSPKSPSYVYQVDDKMSATWESFSTPDREPEAEDKLSLLKFMMNIRNWKARALRRLTVTNATAVSSSSVDEQPSFEVKDRLQSLSFWDQQYLNPRPLFYCTLFPVNHEFEQHTVVQLWMALGCFSMECHAGFYFDKCVAEGYLEFSGTSLVTGEPMYRFKDTTYDLLLSLISRVNHVVRIAGNSYLNDITPEMFHASIRCCNLKDVIAFQRFNQLKTLIFLQGDELSLKQISRDFFLSLGQLLVLDLSKTSLTDLPSSIGNMKHLCYLDLSYTPIKRLPETLDRLFKLQTLKLTGCSNLFVLPKGMRKLINLRHLDFDVFRQLRSMPVWMGELTNIQTLSAFLVGLEEECCIKQLKNMNNLSGNFCISRLENVLKRDDAEGAFLCNKSRIRKLELHWSDLEDEDVTMYGEILSCLKPNTSLQVLQISCFGGFELPTWICDPAFSNLVSITLFEFEYCVALPSLGQLPSLKNLAIVNFNKLKVIDHNFYGGLGIPGYIAFPKLEKLTVESMFSLEEWSGLSSFDFPSLVKLTVKHCPNLHRFCTLSSLCSLKILEISHCEVLASCPDGKLPAQMETLIIEDCPLISTRFLNEGDQDWCKIPHIQNVWIDDEEKSFG